MMMYFGQSRNTQRRGRLQWGKRSRILSVKTRVINGLVVFDLPEDSEPVTSERVKELEAEER